MAKKFGFFNSINGDRKYLASDIAEAFGIGITTGLKSEEGNLQVVPYQNMQIKINPGGAMIFGHFYLNDEEEVIDIDIADGELNRIDRIVLRYDKYERSIKTVLIKGTPALTPSAPIRLETGEQFDLVLADIYVSKAASSITNINITDMRESELCGYIGVKGAVSNIEFESHMADYKKGTMNRIILTVSANRGDGVVNYILGEEYVSSITSNEFGLAINLQDIPSDAKISGNFIRGSSNAFNSPSGNNIDLFLYQRSCTQTGYIVGIKPDAAQTHYSWSEIISGNIWIAIAW